MGFTGITTMKNLIISITIFYFLINLLLRYLLLNAEGGSGLGYLFITPIFWVFYFLLFAIVASVYRGRVKNIREDKVISFKILILINVIITVFFVINFLIIIR
jgi:hypothetical protein